MKSFHSTQAHFPLSIPCASLPIFKFSLYNHTPHNLLLCAQMNVVIWATLRVCYFQFRLFLSWIGSGGGSDVFVWVFLKGHALIHSRKWEDRDFFHKKILISRPTPQWKTYLPLLFSKRKHQIYEFRKKFPWVDASHNQNVFVVFLVIIIIVVIVVI